MRLRLVANVRRKQSKLDGLLANVCEHSRTFSFIERRAGFVTWWSRLATAPDTPTYIVIHGGQSTGRVHPPNQFVPEIVKTFAMFARTCSSYITDSLFFQRTYFF